MSGGLRLLELMLTARRFDEAVLRLAPEIDGHHHVSHGLEASAAALALAREPGDLVATNYRNHAHLICLDADPARLLAEMLGRPVAPQLGRSGSMHLADPAAGVLYTSAMVAGGVPQAVGYALALKRTERGASFAFFGDGAFQEGVVHESLGLARIWELPVVFVCENNGGEPSLDTLATAHGVRSEAVDGRRPRAVVTVLAAAAEYARTARAPAFLDVRSTPWPGNASFYPKDITGPTDVLGEADGEWEAADPVLVEARALLADGVGRTELAALDAAVTRTIEAAVDDARTLPAASASPAEIAHGDVWGPRP